MSEKLPTLLVTPAALKRMVYVVNMEEDRSVRKRVHRAGGAEKKKKSTKPAEEKALRLSFSRVKHLADGMSLLDLVNQIAAEELEHVVEKAIDLVASRKGSVVKVKDVMFVLRNLYPQKEFVAEPASLDVVKHKEKIAQHIRNREDFLVSPKSSYKDQLATEDGFKFGEPVRKLLQFHIEKYILDHLMACALFCTEAKSNTIYASQLEKAHAIICKGLGC